MEHGGAKPKVNKPANGGNSTASGDEKYEDEDEDDSATKTKKRKAKEPPKAKASKAKKVKVEEASENEGEEFGDCADAEEGIGGEDGGEGEAEEV